MNSIYTLSRTNTALSLFKLNPVAASSSQDKILMFAVFKRVTPESDGTGLDLKEAFLIALELFNRKAGERAL